MNFARPKKIVFAAGSIFFTTVAFGCGARIEGTYSNLGDGMVLDLRSSGKADVTMLGEVQHCSWKGDDKKVTVTCGRDSIDFAVHDDGSLSGPAFAGILKKSKS